MSSSKPFVLLNLWLRHSGNGYKSTVSVLTELLSLLFTLFSTDHLHQHGFARTTHCLTPRVVTYVSDARYFSASFAHPSEIKCCVEKLMKARRSENNQSHLDSTHEMV